MYSTWPYGDTGYFCRGTTTGNEIKKKSVNSPNPILLTNEERTQIDLGYAAFSTDLFTSGNVC